MFNFKTNPDGSNEISLLSADDITTLLKLFTRLFKRDDLYLNYNVNWILEYYHSNKINWLKSSDGKVIAPYEVIFDYRNREKSNWGSFIFKGNYEFPNELARIKEEMVKSFKNDGTLSKGDNPCPRVSRIIENSNTLNIEIQKAWYYDQVGTNLTLDFKQKSELADKLGASTTREWDSMQSDTSKGEIPSLEKSKLANTIGVAVGIVAKNKNQQKIVLTRKRSNSVAVYKDMLHLPFTFALNIDNNDLSDSKSILDFIKPDFRHEQAEELGLEPAEIDLKDVKPLLFCRDMCRGGKPQFFLEIEIKTPYEDLVKRIKETTEVKEFAGDTGGNFQETLNRRNFSPELLAYFVLKS